jgi:molybdopterin converting factor small subunit
MKLCKLEIQKRLNQSLPQDLFQLIKLMESKPNQIIDFSPYITELDQLLKYLDTFFFFERKSVSVSNSPVFQADLRNWITQLCTILNWSGSFAYGRRIMLHILRSPGVGAWGSNLFTWTLPNVLTDVYLNHYLLCLEAFLGPVEELEELLGQQEEEKKTVKKQMQELETDNWIVVDDDEFLTSKESNTTLLHEADYIALFPQFNVPVLFEFFVRTYTLQAMNVHGTSIQFGNEIIKTFAIAHRILSFFARALSLLPKDYVQARRLLATNMILFTDIVANQMQVVNNQDASIYFKGKDGTTRETAVDIEVDKFFYRAIRALLSSAAIGVGNFITQIRMDHLSPRAVGDMLGMFVKGQLFSGLHRGTEDEIWLQQLLRESDPLYLFEFIDMLLTAEHKGNPNVDERIIMLSLKHCLRNTDFQERLYPQIKQTLQRLCDLRPMNISLILEETRSNFMSFDHLVADLFQTILSPYWTPSSKDIEILENLLKDPIDSTKATLARQIIDKVDWEGLLDIPSAYHKRIGLTIANIHLDYVGRSQETIPGKLLSSAIEITQKLASVSLYQTQQKLFADWCWNTLIRLQLYSIPKDYNSYALSQGGGRLGKPFENIESTHLVSLKAHLNSDAVATYTYLMLSEVSHRYDLFEVEGWDLLAFLLRDQKYVAVLEIGLLVLHTFYKIFGDELFTMPQFLSLSNQFWKQVSDADIDRIEKYVAHFFELIRFRNNYVTSFAIKFLTGWTFVNRQWMKQKRALCILNSLAKSVLHLPEAHDLLSQMNQEYRALLMQSQNQGKQVAMPSPLQSLLRLASNQIYDKFPVLSYLPTYSFAVEKESILGPNGSSLYTHYLLFALTTEVYAEADLRREVGLNLLKNPSEVSFHQIAEFSIFKVAKTFLEIPLDHPTTPLLLQTLCNLYFQRNQEPGPYFGLNFGSSFMYRDEKLFAEVKTKLSNAKDNGTISKTTAKFYSAVHYWLSDQSLLDCIDVFHISQDYYPSLLQSCLESTLLNHGCSAWWLALLPEKPISQQMSVPELPLEYRERLKLEPAKTLAIVEPLEEITIKSITLNQARVVLEEELGFLKNQAKYHSSYLKSHNEKDELYLQDIQKLYLNETMKLTTTKHCSSSCPGITIQYTKNQANMLGSISHDLEFNNSQITSCCSIDFVDRRTALSGLRIRSVLELIHTETNLVDSKLRPFFFDILDLLEQKLQAFPPAEILVKEILDELERLVVFGNEEETLKLFDRMLVSNHVALLVKYFRPTQFPSKFVYLYSKSTKFKGEDAELVLNRFQISEWIQKNAADVKEVTKLLQECIQATKLHENDPIAFDSHSIILQGILKSDLEDILPVATQVILETFVVGNLGNHVIK